MESLSTSFPAVLSIPKWNVLAPMRDLRAHMTAVGEGRLGSIRGLT